MLKGDLEKRLSDWYKLRKDIEEKKEYYSLLIDFWSDIKPIAFNHRVDPYNTKKWPTPWDIISENKFDDFTLALMMGYSLKLTNKFADIPIEIHTMVDRNKTKLYNILVINNDDVLNYSKAAVIKTQDIDPELYLENKVEIVYPR